jgi:hypothetical protein
LSVENLSIVSASFSSSVRVLPGTEKLSSAGKLTEISTRPKVFTLPSALAQNIATMLVARLVRMIHHPPSFPLPPPHLMKTSPQIAGIAASAPMTNVGGSMSDIWSVEERGFPMAVFSGTILWV